MSFPNEELSKWIQLTNILSRGIYANSKAHGFWPDGDRNNGEAIALAHAELSEALEALRDGNPPSKKAQGFTQVEEELADCIVRILDLAYGREWDVAGALVAKMKFNVGRPEKHGRKF
ncbi:MAG: hypothetical protein KAS32_19975 [Candidatus Peribacteraceae bacterium]|nr:hypothetical protein [Candidatus Peribacteraceae bacterium]